MKNLSPSTLAILQRVEELSGRPIEFRPDSSLNLRATLQMARHGAPAHLLRYRTTNEPLDYWVAYQATYALRLFELPADERMDLRGTGEAERQVEALLRAGQPLDATDREALPRYKEIVAHWALMNLRSFPIGLRIDQWLACEHPELREMQLAVTSSLSAALRSHWMPSCWSFLTPLPLNSRTPSSRWAAALS